MANHEQRDKHKNSAEHALTEQPKKVRKPNSFWRTRGKFHHNRT